MSAKHKRPFYVFAAIAAVCCMVLVTGIRGSRADDGRGPVAGGSLLTESGAMIERSPDADDATSTEVGDGSTGGARPGLEGDPDATLPDPDRSLTGPDGGDAESEPKSGLTVLPPLDLAIPPVVVDPPVTDDTSDGKGRGDRGGKKGKDKDEQGEDETDADAESEDEVDPNVYGLPEDEGDDADELEGDQAEEPVDPETTP